MHSKQETGTRPCGAKCPYRNPRRYEYLLIGAGAFFAWTVLSAIAGVERFSFHDEHEHSLEKVEAGQGQHAGGRTNQSGVPLVGYAISQPDCSDKGEKAADRDPPVSASSKFRKDQRPTGAESTPDQVLHSLPLPVPLAQHSAKAGA